MTLFYLPAAAPGEAFLSGEESIHAVRVLRLKARDELTLTDGKGNLYRAVITEAHPKRCRLTIAGNPVKAGDPPGRLHLAVAPTKNSERISWLLEKATEIGLKAYTPLLCRHGERMVMNRTRLVNVAAAAMKQSGKAHLPVIHDPVAFAAFIDLPGPGNRFIAHCRPPEKPFLKNLIPSDGEVLVLIGPEGDFSEEEVEQARIRGFREVSLGPSLLRTETAALAACAAVYFAGF